MTAMSGSGGRITIQHVERRGVNKADCEAIPALSNGADTRHRALSRQWALFPRAVIDSKRIDRCPKHTGGDPGLCLLNRYSLLSWRLRDSAEIYRLDISRAIRLQAEAASHLQYITGDLCPYRKKLPI